MKLLINGKSIEVHIESISGSKINFSSNGKSYLVERAQVVPGHGTAEKIPSKKASKKNSTRAAKGISRVDAPIPGVVSKIFVSQGDTVEEGDPLLVLEAMKMQNRIFASHGGVIASIEVQEQEEVSDGQILLYITDGQVP
jgi:glutaconyl-CoA/methylmalonyl-CoA decarboxylase subunit gamma